MSNVVAQKYLPSAPLVSQLISNGQNSRHKGDDSRPGLAGGKYRVSS